MQILYILNPNQHTIQNTQPDILFKDKQTRICIKQFNILYDSLFDILTSSLTVVWNQRKCTLRK